MGQRTFGAQREDGRFGMLPWLGLGLLIYLALSAYFRFRAQPEGVNGRPRSYRVPAENITFHYDASWYENGKRKAIRQITDLIVDTIRRARLFVVFDMFHFNHHHISEGDFIPTTRVVTEALQAKRHPRYFITDPVNTVYGTESSDPIRWLQDSGVNVYFTRIRRLRDSNLVYSPFWRLFFQWFGTGSTGSLSSPMQAGKKITIRALLEALNGRGNHRKVLVADQDDSYVTIITSANLADSNSYYGNTAIKIRDQAVARHFLEAEKAVARMSGYEMPVTIPAQERTGDTLVTPLMGDQIKESILEDLRAAERGDELYLVALFLSDRDVIEGLVGAAKRGVDTVVVLDKNRISFGREKSGFPNRVVAAELDRRAGIKIRWANTRKEELHTKLLLLKKADRCIINTGSANFIRRNLSNTVLEANIRVEASLGAQVSRDALQYARWLSYEPRSLPSMELENSRPKYWVYRVQEATGTGMF